MFIIFSQLKTMVEQNMTNLKKRNLSDLETLEQTEEEKLENLRKLAQQSPMRPQAAREYNTARAAASEARKQSSSAQISSALQQLDEIREKSLERLRSVKANKNTTPQEEQSAVNDFVSATALVKEAKRKQAYLDMHRTSETMQLDNSQKFRR